MQDQGRAGGARRNGQILVKASSCRPATGAQVCALHQEPQHHVWEEEEAGRDLGAVQL